MNARVINIVAVDPIGDYGLRLTFDDGVVQKVDFEPFLRSSPHPEIAAYLDKKRFASFRLEYGELIWDDYQLCFPIIDLYTNRIDKHHLLASAA